MTSTLDSTGRTLTRYGLVLILIWTGAMHFTMPQRLAMIEMLAGNPLLDWALEAFTPRQLGGAIGIIELVGAVMIAMRPISGAMSCLGSVLAAIIFTVSLARLAGSATWETSLGGFPATSVMPGQFLLKDLVLLGAALWTAGEAGLNRG